MKALKSPYSKMYLVTTSVYDKLLTCLDEKEKKSTELLNIAKQKEERPGEKVIGEITSGDFEPVVTQEQQIQPIEMQPELVEEIPPTQEVFGEDEIEQIDQPITEEVGEVMQPPATPPGPPGEPEYQSIQQQNPLRTICPTTTTDPSRVIPEQQFPSKPYGPTQTQKAAFKIIKKYKTIKPLIRQVTKQVTKPILYAPQITKPILYAPQILQEPQIKESSVGIVGKKQKNCPICKKHFQRPWSLVRHVGTVHKNLGSVHDILTGKTQQVVDPLPSTSQPVTVNPTIVKKPTIAWKFIRDVDVPMMSDIEKPEFEKWIKPGKRTASKANLPTKPARKRMQQTEQKESFESWK